MSNVVRKKLSQCQKQIVRSLGLSDLEPFKAADTINRFCENLNLPTNIHDAVCKVSLRALDMGFVNGIYDWSRSFEWVLSMVYMIVVGLSTWVLSMVYMLVVGLFALAVLPGAVWLYAVAWQGCCSHICMLIAFLRAGKCPLSIAAATVVLVCGCSDKEIVRVSNVSLTTVRNCIHMLEENKAELFKDVELPSEPFHFRSVLWLCYTSACPLVYRVCER